MVYFIPKLSKSYSQIFSFPTPFIHYILENNKPDVGEKLMRCCKTLKFLHHSFHSTECEKLLISSPKIHIAVKSIKILDKFSIFLDYQDIDDIFNKVDLSCAETVFVDDYFGILPVKFLHYMLKPSITRFMLTVQFPPDFFPFLHAFKELQNARFIHCSKNPLTKSCLKELIGIKRKTKISICGMAIEADVDFEDILVMAQMHMTESGLLNLYIFGSDTSSENEFQQKINHWKENQFTRVLVKLNFEKKRFVVKK